MLWHRYVQEVMFYFVELEERKLVLPSSPF